MRSICSGGLLGVGVAHDSEASAVWSLPLTWSNFDIIS